MNYNDSRMTPPPYYGGQEVVTQTNAVMRRVYVRMFIGLLISDSPYLHISAVNS